MTKKELETIYRDYAVNIYHIEDGIDILKRERLGAENLKDESYRKIDFGGVSFRNINLDNFKAFLINELTGKIKKQEAELDKAINDLKRLKII